MNTNVCLDCGKIIGKNHTRCFECHSRSQIKPWNCGWCKKEVFEPRKKRVYCSSECREQARDERFKGVDQYEMNGRKWSFGRRTRFHRYVMEQHLGRKLLREEVVHHKDGDKTNNDISNLEILTPSEHAKLHYSTEKLKVYKGRGIGEPNYNNCNVFYKGEIVRYKSIPKNERKYCRYLYKAETDKETRKTYRMIYTKI